jgi:hypothetical protein
MNYNTEPILNNIADSSKLESNDNMSENKFKCAACKHIYSTKSNLFKHWRTGLVCQNFLYMCNTGTIYKRSLMQKPVNDELHVNDLYNINESYNTELNNTELNNTELNNTELNNTELLGAKVNEHQHNVDVNKFTPMRKTY